MEVQTSIAEHGPADLADLTVLHAYGTAAIGAMHDCILRTLVASSIAGTQGLDNFATFQHQFASVLT